MKLIEELERADAVLIGAPIYSCSIPSALKACAAVASRGGSHAPGTPREGYEFVQNHLEAVLKTP